MLSDRFVFIFGSNAYKYHFWGDEVFQKGERLFEHEMYFWFGDIFVGFSFNLFEGDTQEDSDLIEIIVVPLELFVVGLVDVWDFVQGALVLFAVLGDLLLRKPKLFDTGGMRDKRGNRRKVPGRVCHLSGAISWLGTFYLSRYSRFIN